MLWKRKLLILTVWVLAGGGGIAVVWRWPAIYKSEALVLVDSQKIPEKFVSSTVSTDLQDRLASINQQILSTSHLKKIIDDFGLYREARKTRFEEEILEMMRKDISVKLDRGWVGNRPGAFRVGYQGPDPAVTAQVANRVANLYIEGNLKTREVEAEGTAEFIDTQLQEAKKALDSLEAAVSAYKLKHNGELPEQQNALLGTLSGLQAQLEANRDALNRAQQSKATLEVNLQTAEDAQRVLRRALETPAAVAEMARVAAPPAKKKSEILAEQLTVLRARGLTDRHPDVKALLKALENAKDAERHGDPVPADTGARPVRPAARPSLTVLTAEPALEARIRELKAQIAVMDTELATRKAEQSEISRAMSRTQAKVNNLPVREQEMAALMRDYDMSKANYKSLLDKKFSAEMATDMERRQKSERFTIIDPAPVPMLPAKPNRPLLGSIAALGALLLGILLAIGEEIRRDVLLGEWELPGGTVVIARLPHFSIFVGDAAGRGDAGAQGRRWSTRLAVISSVLLGLLGAAAAGAYLISHRF